MSLAACCGAFGSAGRPPTGCVGGRFSIINNSQKQLFWSTLRLGRPAWCFPEMPQINSEETTVAPLPPPRPQAWKFTCGFGVSRQDTLTSLAVKLASRSESFRILVTLDSTLWYYYHRRLKDDVLSCAGISQAAANKQDGRGGCDRRRLMLAAAATAAAPRSAAIKLTLRAGGA